MVTNNKPDRIKELRRGQEAILAGLSELREAILKAQSEFNQRLDEITDLFRQQILESPEEEGLGRRTEDEIPAMAGAFNFEDPNASINKRPPSEAICAKKNQLPAAVPIKFGMITHDLLDEGGYDMKVYLVDVVAGGGVMANEYHPIVPTGEIQFRPKGSLPAICAVKSTVYIFEGSRYYLFRRRPPNPEEKSAYKWVFPSDKLLRDIPPMNQLKSDPIALPTPDGEKILVFSGRFILNDSGGAFELLDTCDDSWTQVPPLPCLDSCTKSASKSWCFCNSDCIAEAKAYSFIGDSQFILQINRGVFVLDLNKREWATLGVFVPPGLNKWKWATLGIPKVVPDDHEGYFETVKGRYTLIPRRGPKKPRCDDDDGLPALWAYDFGEDGLFGKDAIDDEFRGKKEHWCQLSILPRPCNGKYLQLATVVSILPLRPIEQEDGVCTSRVVQVDVEEPLNKARILVNVCRTDLATMETSISNCVGLTFDFSESPSTHFFNI